MGLELLRDLDFCFETEGRFCLILDSNTTTIKI